MDTYNDDFPSPRGSFFTPVQPPDVDPDDDSAIVSVCFNAQWLPFVLGALQQLLLQATWAGEESAILQAQERAALLMDMFAGSEDYTVCCDNVANCINTDDGTRDALQQWYIASGLSYGNPGGGSVPLSSKLTEIVGALGAGCDERSRYGLCYKMVDVLNTTTVNLLDIVVLITDEEQLAYQLAGAIPIIGGLAQQVIGFAHWFLTNVIDTYNAAYNDSSHEAITCQLYCDMGEDCELTLDDMLQSYRAFLGSYSPPPAFATFEDTIVWMQTLVLGVDALGVAVLHYLVLSVWVRGANWLGVSSNTLSIGAQLAIPLDVPASCMCLVVYQWLGGFGVSGLTVLQGTYDAVNDQVVSFYNGAFTAIIEVATTFPAPIAVNRVRYHTHRDPGYACSGGPGRTRTLQLLLGGVVVYEWTRSENYDCIWFERLPPDVMADSLRILHQQSTTATGTKVYLDKIEVYG